MSKDGSAAAAAGSARKPRSARPTVVPGDDNGAAEMIGILCHRGFPQAAVIKASASPRQ